MAIRWPGSGSAVSGSTDFGLYDNDAQFQADAPKIASWCARRLGYPIADVELLDVHFYACFEDAVSEYAAQVNQFNIRNNLFDLKGTSKDTSVTGVDIVGSNLSHIIRMAEDYGSEVGVGGNIDWKTGSIDIQSGSQVYDLNVLFRDQFESGSEIEVKRVFHYGTPAISRFFDPFASTGMGTINMMDSFGFGAYSPAVEFVLMPLYEDILRMQAIEFNDTIRKSSYSFELINNKLRVFPRPANDTTLWFQYIVKSDRDNNVINKARSGVVSDYSNVPYQAMTYSDINEVGKQWIRKYTLASAKETLGGIREKFSSIPIPEGEISLDGAQLRAEAQTEKDILLQQLRETLEEVSNKNQMQYKADQADQHQQMLNKIPLPIYIK